MDGWDGMKKLRYGLTAMLILLTVSLAISYLVRSAEEKASANAATYAYGKLNDNEQAALVKFYSYYETPDYTEAYAVAGWLVIALEIGLVMATWKVWHTKEILGASIGIAAKKSKK